MISTSVKYFPEKRGLIDWITTAVYCGSTVILPPIVTFIVGTTDATFAFKSICTAFLMIILLCTFILDICTYGYAPAGYVPPANNIKAKKDMDWKQMMKTPVFYVMLILLTSGAFSGMMIISQASAVAQEMIGMTAIAARAAVSLLS